MNKIRPSEIEIGRALDKGGKFNVFYKRKDVQLMGYMYIHPNFNKSLLVMEGDYDIVFPTNVYKYDFQKSYWTLTKTIKNDDQLKRLNIMLKKLNKKWSYY